MRYRTRRAALIVTKPDGTVLRKEVVLYYDTACDTFGIYYIESGQLQDYAFDVLQRDLKLVRDQGFQTDRLP